MWKCSLICAQSHRRPSYWEDSQVNPAWWVLIVATKHNSLPFLLSSPKGTCLSSPCSRSFPHQLSRPCSRSLSHQFSYGSQDWTPVGLTQSGPQESGFAFVCDSPLTHKSSSLQKLNIGRLLSGVCSWMKHQETENWGEMVVRERSKCCRGIFTEPQECWAEKCQKSWKVALWQ